MIHQSPTYAEYLAADSKRKAQISEELVNAIQWRDDHCYIIWDKTEQESVDTAPLYVCYLDEDGKPLLGKLMSLASRDPEDFEPPILHPLCEVIPQF